MTCIFLASPESRPAVFLGSRPPPGQTKGGCRGTGVLFRCHWFPLLFHMFSPNKIKIIKNLDEFIAFTKCESGGRG